MKQPFVLVNTANRLEIGDCIRVLQENGRIRLGIVCSCLIDKVVFVDASGNECVLNQVIIDNKNVVLIQRNTPWIQWQDCEFIELPIVTGRYTESVQNPWETKLVNEVIGTVLIPNPTYQARFN